MVFVSVFYMVRGEVYNAWKAHVFYVSTLTTKQNVMFSESQYTYVLFQIVRNVKMIMHIYVFKATFGIILKGNF